MGPTPGPYLRRAALHHGRTPASQSPHWVATRYLLALDDHHARPSRASCQRRCNVLRAVRERSGALLPAARPSHRARKTASESGCVSKAFKATCVEVRIHHLLTRPTRPRLTGEAEHFEQTSALRRASSGSSSL